MLITLIIVAIALWLVFAYLIPMLPEPIRTIATIVIVIASIVYLLRIAGMAII